MKKFLLILNEIRSPAAILEYVIAIARAQPSFIQGVFLKRSEHSLYPYPFPNDFPLTEVKGSEKEVRKEDAQLLQDYIKLFKDQCEAAGIKYQVIVDENKDLKRLIHYSLFADCIVADARVDLEKYPLHDILVDAYCPIILVKSEVELPKKVILTYDGSTASMQAIKMYSYLFPDWKQLPTYLISVRSSEEKEVKYKDDLHSWSSIHFTQLSNVVLVGDVKTELVQLIQQQGEHVLIVMGASGRTALSRMLYKSLAAVLLTATTATLFVMHR